MSVQVQFKVKLKATVNSYAGGLKDKCLYCHILLSSHPTYHLEADWTGQY